MKNIMTDYAREFDKLVDDYNLSLENSKIGKRNWRAFFMGMGSVLDFFENSLRHTHHLYSGKDLLPEQLEDAIALASDWRRTVKKLDKIICDNSPSLEVSVQDAKMGKPLAESMYDNFRDAYVSYAAARTNK